jgi:hypothetical protein
VGLVPGAALELDFVLPPRRWVDVDTLVESTVAGLRDAGVVAPRLAGLDGITATKRFGAAPGVAIRTVREAPLWSLPPGAVALDVATDAVPLARRDAKRMWRDTLDRRWSGRPVLTGAVWTDVALAGEGSLLGRLEVVLDALEPVLGRDPRGRPWQEFFPNDDRIEWLRVRRDRAGPALRLQLGSMAS